MSLWIPADLHWCITNSNPWYYDIAWYIKGVFIICNGPSLRPEDLTKIHEHGDVSIAMNMIARIYDKTPWRPTFLSATDDCVFDPLNRDLVEECECGIKLYDCKRYMRSLKAKGNLLYLNHVSCWIFQSLKQTLLKRFHLLEPLLIR